jgi:hypothetical protein
VRERDEFGEDNAWRRRREVKSMIGEGEGSLAAQQTSSRTGQG